MAVGYMLIALFIQMTWTMIPKKIFILKKSLLKINFVLIILLYGLAAFLLMNFNQMPIIMRNLLQNIPIVFSLLFIIGKDTKILGTIPKTLSQWGSKYSLGIFLWHYLFLQIFSVVIPVLWTYLGLNHPSIIVYILINLLGFGSALFFSMFLNRYLPQLLSTKW
jgi:peptidoglycan/LPS O-acetylase OafA/YrhL